MGKQKSENVLVILRVRPLNSKEKDAGYREVVQLDIAKNCLYVNEAGIDGRAWSFDAVYNNSFAQKDVYNQSIRPLVDTVLAGYNATIFAYGQSGTGKTYSMCGNLAKKEQYGIIPNALNHIFTSIEELKSDKNEFIVKAQFVELYNGKCRDLLKEGQLNLELKENSQKQFYVKDLSTWDISSTEQAMKLMEEGLTRRETKATELNTDSSRSHSLFTVTVKVWDKEQDLRTESKLNLVDLAGSERQSKTGATGDTLKEGSNINLSLTALGTVIDCLVKNKPHIPYRSTQLTMLLKDGLGGNSRTVIVGTIGPADHNSHETVSTLRFIDRAKQIKNKPRVQMDPKDARIAELTELVKKLKQQFGIASDEEKDDEEVQAVDVNCKNKSRVTLIDDELEKYKQRVEELELSIEANKETVENAQQLQIEMEAKEKRLEEQFKSKENRLQSEIEELKDRYSLLHDDENEKVSDSHFQQLLSICTDFLVAVDTSKIWIPTVRRSEEQKQIENVVGNLMPTIDDIRNGFKMVQTNGVDMSVVVVRKHSLLIANSSELKEPIPPKSSVPVNSFTRSASPTAVLREVVDRDEVSVKSDIDNDELFPQKYKNKRKEKEKKKSQKSKLEYSTAAALPDTAIDNVVQTFGMNDLNAAHAHTAVQELLAHQRVEMLQEFTKRASVKFRDDKNALPAKEAAELLAAFEQMKEELEANHVSFSKQQHLLEKSRAVADKKISEIITLKEYVDTLREEISNQKQKYQENLEKQQELLIQQLNKKTEQLISKQSKSMKAEKKAREQLEKNLGEMSNRLSQLEKDYDLKVMEYETLLREFEDSKFEHMKKFKEMSNTGMPTLNVPEAFHRNMINTVTLDRITGRATLAKIQDLLPKTAPNAIPH